MIWTVEPTAPWRVTAADPDASARARARTTDATLPASAQTTLLDWIHADDRTAIEAALTTARSGEMVIRPCREHTGAPGQLTLTPLVRLDNPREIIAVWTPAAASRTVAISTAATTSARAGAGAGALKATPPTPLSAAAKTPSGVHDANGVNGDGSARVVDDQTLRQVIGMIGHDLRTPLNGVLGMSRLLLDSGLRADQIDYARAIDTSAEHLLSVIEDLLEFATLDLDTALHPVDFGPRALVEDVVDSLMWRASEKEIEICAIVSASVPELVEGDASRLRQVLGYLVGDGITWAGVGDVVVRVSREQDAEPGILLRFDVSVNDPSDSDRFPSDARTSAPASRGAAESLGEPNPRAAVWRHLVQVMGGTTDMQVDGATRTWWFTARVQLRPAPPLIVPAYVSLTGRRILCVDDHPVSQRVLLERLRGWGLLAESADEAHGALTLMKVASAAGKPFELAILDLRLPGLDGLALARLIKNDPSLAPTRLVLLTGYPARGQAALAQEAGIDAYLQKPIREAPLRSCLEALLSGSRLPSSPLLTGRQFEEERANLLRPRVLVAEDNPIGQKVAVQMLEKLGCRVDVVAGGAEAVQAVVHTPYHLVLMDCQLEGMDGLAAVRAIRRMAGHVDSPPIIALTGSTGEDDRQACFAAGMNDFMSKPLRLGTLREKLAQWIASSPR
jgi:CheY-like chemotaxis protein